jgi:hypothetical protein
MNIGGIEINPDDIWYIQEAALKGHTLVKIWKQKDKIDVPLPWQEVKQALISAGYEVKM